MLADWLEAHRVEQVAMEATGVYWKPVWAVLEDRVRCMLVNAHHVKQVPGRKTDVSDAQWLCGLVEAGLLRANLVPPKPIRTLRNLTRYRKTQIQDRQREANRLHRILEDSGIKLDCVATDILGKSGRAMLEALVQGTTDPEILAELALDFLDEAIERLSDVIEEQIRPFDQALELLCMIPGIQRRTAEVIIAETGGDMSAFPTAKHLASWAGVCPGNDKSAGKRRLGKTRKGSKWLRAALGEAVLAATRSKNTYLAAQYRRLRSRRGHSRAVTAVAHSILVAAWHMLQTGELYNDPGADYFARRDPERHTRRLVAQLERLGHNVILRPQAEAA